MFDLTELQRDALMEVFNIGVGRASRSLSLLLGCETAMSVPVIVQASFAEASRVVDSSLKQHEDVCMISRMLGGIEAEAVMIFQGPRENIATLFNLPASAKAKYSDVRHNVAAQLSAMITDSCADQIQDLVGFEVTRSEVKFFPMISDSVFAVHNQPDDVLIIVKIDIALKKKGVTGHLLLSFSQDSANQLARGLDRLIGEGEGG